MSEVGTIAKPDLAGWESVRDAARRKGCSESWVRWLRANGRLAVLATPLGDLIFAADVDAAMVKRSA